MDELTQDYKEFLYERLQDPAEAAEYLNAALEDEDATVFLLALRDVAEVSGMTKVAKAAALNRENVYRILSDQGNPRLSSMLALLRAVGVQLQVKPQKEEVAQRTSENFVVKPTLLDIERAELPGLRDCTAAEDEGYYGSENESAAA
jgi:probable addiction module antidote protein